MKNKERFIRAIARYQNFNSHKETKSKLLEKAFGSDTRIFDFDGVDELLDTVIDMSVFMFPNLSEEEIRENIEWFVYEAVDMENPEVIDPKGKTYIVKTSDILYDMLEDFNEIESR